MGLPIARGQAGAPRSASQTRRKAPILVTEATQAAPDSAKKPVQLFPTAAQSRAFYRRFYPGTGPAEWNDWRWQMRTRIRSLEELERIFRLSADEHAAVKRHEGALPVGITPYYASLMGLEDPSEPLRRITCMQRFVRVRGGAYLFLPGRAALRYLAALS